MRIQLNLSTAEQQWVVDHIVNEFGPANRPAWILLGRETSRVWDQRTATGHIGIPVFLLRELAEEALGNCYAVDGDPIEIYECDVQEVAEEFASGTGDVLLFYDHNINPESARVCFILPEAFDSLNKGVEVSDS